MKRKLDDFYVTEDDLLKAGQELIDTFDLAEYEYEGKITAEMVAWKIKIDIDKMLQDMIEYPDSYFNNFDSSDVMKNYEKLFEKK